MGVYIWKERLPSAYQEVEYIESSGTQWIDTGVTATQNTKSQIKFMSLEYTGDVIYGMYNGNDNADYRLFNGYNGTPASSNIGTCIFDFNSSRIESGTGVLSTNQIFELELGNYYVKDISTGTNIVSGTAISSYTSSRTITLNNYNNSTYPKTRWYYVRIWEGATQIRDLVPCYRKSDGVIGLYDLVNSTFYTNSGNGIFTKGQDINYNYIEYDLKNAYIGEYKEGYKYIRWTITANRNNIAVTQMSEFEICDNSGTKMARPSGTTITGSIIGPSGETVDKLIDGSTSTKYCPNGSLPIVITITLGAAIDLSVYNKYKRYTANDERGRDPKSWAIEVSRDGSNWDTVSTVTNASIPTTRYVLAGTWDITVN